MCPVTQWRDERDKGERDREIARWDEETGVIMDYERQREILTLPWHRYLRLWEEERKRKVLKEKKQKISSLSKFSLW